MARRRTIMEARCIGCGCSDSRACVVDGTPCHWLAVDRELGLGVCSACPPEKIATFERQVAAARKAKP